MEHNFKRLLHTEAVLFVGLMLIMAAVALGLGQYLLAVIESACGLAMLVIHLLTARRRARGTAEYIRSSVDTLSAVAAGKSPQPMLMVRLSDGEVLWNNRAFAQQFPHGETLIGRPVKELLPAVSLEEPGKDTPTQEQALNGRNFLVLSNHSSKETEEETTLLCLVDATELIHTRDEFARTRPVVAVILIDNFEELTNNLPDSAVSKITAALNEEINAWAEHIGGLLRRLERNRFLFVLEEKNMIRAEEEKFSLLENIRQVTSPTAVAATISMGFGKNGAGFQEDYDFALLALEMALSRGGDQAVVKDRYSFNFYGGRAKETGRRTKVKSRVMASSLAELVAHSSRVYIMGHKNADADAIGAAAGVCALCRKRGKKANIVLDLRCCAANTLVERLKASPEYKDCFISPQDALLTADARSLLVVVDTNRPDQVENLPLLQSMNRVTVIDHHRRAADYIQTAALSIHEPFASSACEIVTELLTYAVDPRDILSCELEALLAGIVLDTKNFSVRVNSRTFEAAAFLRAQGADPVAVKRLFQSDFADTVTRYKIVQRAQAYRDTIAVAVMDEPVSRAIAGQAADELLNIAGIDTSFVLFYQEKTVFISARSIGDINVQMILEPLGGGGNAATAGAQLKDKTMPQVQKALIEAIDRYFATE